MSEDIHCTSEINHECLSQNVGAGKKRQAQMAGSQSIGWQKPYSTTRKQFTGQWIA